MRALETGRRGRVTRRVGDDDTAARWGNDVPVLATPVLLWLGEMACMRAVEDALEPGEMTVGAGHDCRHLAPTPVGVEVTITATLAGVDGRRLVFTVEGRDDRQAILEGTHVRGVVDRERFVAGIAARATTGG